MLTCISNLHWRSLTPRALPGFVTSLTRLRSHQTRQSYYLRASNTAGNVQYSRQTKLKRIQYYTTCSEILRLKRQLLILTLQPSEYNLLPVFLVVIHRPLISRPTWSSLSWYLHWIGHRHWHWYCHGRLTPVSIPSILPPSSIPGFILVVLGYPTLSWGRSSSPRVKKSTCLAISFSFPLILSLFSPSLSFSVSIPLAFPLPLSGLMLPAPCPVLSLEVDPPLTSSLGTPLMLNTKRAPVFGKCLAMSLVTGVHVTVHASPSTVKNYWKWESSHAISFGMRTVWNCTPVGRTERKGQVPCISALSHFTKMINTVGSVLLNSPSTGFSPLSNVAKANMIFILLAYGTACPRNFTKGPFPLNRTGEEGGGLVLTVFTSLVQ